MEREPEMEEKRKTFLNVPIDASIRDDLKAAASADGRSMAGLIKKILRDWLVENGYDTITHRTL